MKAERYIMEKENSYRGNIKIGKNNEAVSTESYNFIKDSAGGFIKRRLINTINRTKTIVYKNREYEVVNYSNKRSVINSTISGDAILIVEVCEGKYIDRYYMNKNNNGDGVDDILDLTIREWCELDERELINRHNGSEGFVGVSITDILEKLRMKENEREGIRNICNKSICSINKYSCILMSSIIFNISILIQYIILLYVSGDTVKLEYIIACLAVTTLMQIINKRIYDKIEVEKNNISLTVGDAYDYKLECINVPVFKSIAKKNEIKRSNKDILGVKFDEII